MEFKEIRELIRILDKTDLTEFVMHDGDFRLTIRTKNYVKGKHRDATPQMVSVSPPQVMPIQQMPAAQPPISDLPVSESVAPNPAGEPATETVDESHYLQVKSPIVGTFYRSSSPDKPVFKKVGDTVEKGEVVCIVEAMKLFNEIESEVSGKIVKVLVEDASPVEYDQPLFLVDPKG